MNKRSELRVPALEIRQGRRRLYQFAVDGKKLKDFTTVTRIHRDTDAHIGGYQRPEALAHIRAIREYLESDGAMLPNALVIAFDKRVRFKKAPGSSPGIDTSIGELIIPIDPELADEDKPGWIVDGQQRSAALRDATVRRFPMPIVGFITDDMAEQRSQFILVNTTKPLPKGLIHELLPATEGKLPAALARKRYPAVLLDRLNYDEGSPLYQLIRTPTTPEGVIKDNSVLKMLENSLTDGALYVFRDHETGEGDAEKMLALLGEFWSAVHETFPDAWGLPPRKSRLMHGVGIVGLGFVMDAITDLRVAEGVEPRKAYAEGLELLRPSCAWTEGWWEFGLHDRRRWNELQNTPKDIALLADFLLAEYRARIEDGAEVIRRRATG